MILRCFLFLFSFDVFAAEPAKKIEEPKIDDMFKRSTGYVHNWKDFPKISGRAMSSKKEIEVVAKKGHSYVVIFIASWCDACQKHIAFLKDLQKELSKKFVHFYFVFSHDTDSDAYAFAKDYGLIESSIIVDAEMLKAYKNPPLPTIYLSDRSGWLLKGYVDFKLKDQRNIIEDIRKYTFL